jgi:hypothetical protein
MVLVFIVFVPLAMAVAYWLVKHRQTPPPKERAAATTKSGGRFAGVEIRAHRNACRTARSLEGRRFLAKDAPALPLVSCTAVRCSCTFSKLADRRTDGRRLDHAGLGASLFLNQNRRAKRDRRRAAATVQRS